MNGLATSSATELRRCHAELRCASTVPELLAAAATTAMSWLSCSRALVLTVEDGWLSASDSVPVKHPASDALRRRVQARPIPLLPGSREAEQVRRPGQRPARAGYGALRDVFDSGHVTAGVVHGDGHPVALLVADRREPEFSEAERELADQHAALVGIVLEHVALRVRVGELIGELRDAHATTQALARDVLDAPLALTPRRGPGPAQARFGLGTTAPPSVTTLLTPRELQVARLLIEGLPNRRIADALVLSPDTVKSHVARILRKLGASNRMDAVARLMRMQDPALGDAGPGR